MTRSIYDFKARGIDGADVPLSVYRGSVLLVVNTASECGFTSQYQGLEDLYERFQARGFEVLAFPCNQFGGQEPGSEEEIQQFCVTQFGIKFPLFSKVSVNGSSADPLFDFLKSSAPGFLGSKSIKWNFTKFLVDSHGKVVSRFAPTVPPEDIAERIEEYLN